MISSKPASTLKAQIEYLAWELAGTPWEKEAAEFLFNLVQEKKIRGGSLPLPRKYFGF